MNELQVLKRKEEVEGLNPTGMTSNVGPMGKTFRTKFNCLSIRTACLCVELCCMPSALLGFPTQDPRVILPEIDMVTSLGKSFLFFLDWVVSS